MFFYGINILKLEVIISLEKSNKVSTITNGDFWGIKCETFVIGNCFIVILTNS